MNSQKAHIKVIADKKSNCIRPYWEIGPTTTNSKEILSVQDKFASPEDEPVAIHCHVFHMELFEELTDAWKSIHNRVIFISTDTILKAKLIEKILSAKCEPNFSIKVTPNIGRDIAPLLISWKEEITKFDLFIHCHTKKSPHFSSSGKLWRSSLVEATLRNKVLSSESRRLLKHSASGIVMPWPIYFMCPYTNWGKNYLSCSELMRRMGHSIKEDSFLYYPAGSFFWARTEALKPLFNLGLKQSDFEPEPITYDGHMPHAIERCFGLLAMSTNKISYAAWPGDNAKDFSSYRNKFNKSCLIELPRAPIEVVFSPW